MLSFITSTSAPILRAQPLTLHSHLTRPFLTSFSRRHRRPRCRPTSITPRMAVEKPPVEEEIDPGKVAGTELRVLRYPHPALRAPNRVVNADEFDDQLKKLAREMFLVMYASRGVGLAAPQVGVNKRLMVFNPESDERAFLKEVVLVNPHIVATSKKTLVEAEACLSFPGMQGDVRRHEWVKVEAQRLNGKKFRVKYEGWVAKIFQHEYDHLDGVVYIDKIETEEEKEKVQARLNELVRDFEEDGAEGQVAAL